MCKNEFFQISKTENELFKVRGRKKYYLVSKNLYYNIKSIFIFYFILNFC